MAPAGAMRGTQAPLHPGELQLEALRRALDAVCPLDDSDLRRDPTHDVSLSCADSSGGTGAPGQNSDTADPHACRDPTGRRPASRRSPFT